MAGAIQNAGGTLFRFIRAVRIWSRARRQMSALLPRVRAGATVGFREVVRIIPTAVRQIRTAGQTLAHIAAVCLAGTAMSPARSGLAWWAATSSLAEFAVIIRLRIACTTVSFCGTDGQLGRTVLDASA